MGRSKLNLTIVTEPKPEEVKELFNYAPWANERNLVDITLMLEKTSLSIIVKIDDSLVGFGRVITDYVFRAFIEDVIVHPDFRQRGIGKIIVNTLEEFIRNHGVRRIELSTGKYEFWEKLGYQHKRGHMIKYG